MRVAIIENTRVTHHGQVGVALHEAGAKIDQYKPFADGRLPAPGSFDALVVFGGEQSARDDHSHPYLPALADLMGQAGAAGHAVLGSLPVASGRITSLAQRPSSAGAMWP